MSKENENTHTCPVCGLVYRDREWAKKCEAWCREHHTCNVEIIKHAVNPEDSTATEE